MRIKPSHIWFEKAAIGFPWIQLSHLSSANKNGRFPAAHRKKRDLLVQRPAEISKVLVPAPSPKHDTTKRRSHKRLSRTVVVSKS